MAIVSRPTPAATGLGPVRHRRFQALDADVIDAGFVSDAQEAAVAAEKLRIADPDLIVVFLTTYLTASMVLPIAQRSGAPVLIIDLHSRSPQGHR